MALIDDLIPEFRALWSEVAEITGHAAPAWSDESIRDVLRQELGEEADKAGRLDRPERYETHHYSSAQFNLPENVAAKVKALAKKIPDKDLAEDGREEEIHVTVRWGLHTGSAEKVRQIVDGFGSIKAKLGKTSIFQAKEASAQRGGEQFDVVKIDVDSPDLHRLNKILGDSLDHTDTHPEYKPHITVAYVKPGRGKEYVGMDDLDGEELILSRLTFSDHDDAKTVIELMESPEQASRPDLPARYQVIEKEPHGIHADRESERHANLPAIEDRPEQASDVDREISTPEAKPSAPKVVRQMIMVRDPETGSLTITETEG